MSDEECNPSNRDGCARYHEGAVHCFKMVIPRSAFVLYHHILHKLGVKKIQACPSSISSIANDVPDQKSFSVASKNFIFYNTESVIINLISSKYFCKKP